MQRLLLENLSRTMPFCLLGARGVGKTMFVRDFATKFSNWIYIDLETIADRAIFHNEATDEETLRAISFLKGKEIRGNGTLIVLDEICKCPGAIGWAVGMAKGRTGGPVNKPLVIATSSIMTKELASMVNHENSILPPLFLYPFSFEEFLMVRDDQAALEAFREVPVPYYAYEKLLNYFHLYALIGGMPEITGEYAATDHLTGLNKIYEKTGNRFIDCLQDVTAGAKSRDLAVDVLQNTYPFAATRISFNRFGNLEKGSREIAHAFNALENAFLLELVYPVTSACLPPDTARTKFPRLQMLDTGLVNYFSGIQKPLFRSHDMNAIFEGQIARQVVGQELLATASYNKTDPAKIKKMTNFWVRAKAQSSATVDFVIQFNDMLIPVMVRSGEPGRLRSLHQFLDVAPHQFAVRLSSGQLEIRQCKTIKGKIFYLLNLPYFLAGKINEHLAGFCKYVES